ncbi:MAG: DUF1465 family protein [Pseudomonadota bacterium]
MSEFDVSGKSKMDVGAGGDALPVNLAQHFAHSERFNDLFAYGMGLVEETAGFLDTDGRAAVNELSDHAKALYGTESMRLTTRLMQLASWLLLQRASVEGEMTPQQVLTEKQNVKLSEVHAVRIDAAWNEFPDLFTDLVDRSIALQRRIRRLDEELYADTVSAVASSDARENAVMSQQNLLKTAFG